MNGFQNPISFSITEQAFQILKSPHPACQHLELCKAGVIQPALRSPKKQNLELFYTEFSGDEHTVLFNQHAVQLTVKEQDFIPFPLEKAAFLRCSSYGVMQHYHNLPLELLKGM